MFIVFLYIVIFVVAIQGLLLFAGITNRSRIDCILAVVLSAISLEVCIRFVLIQYFADRAYIITAAPIELTYGPTLFWIYRLLQKDSIKVSTLLLHYMPFFIGVFVYIIYLSTPSFRSSYSTIYYTILYGLTSISWLSYPIYILASKKKSDELDLGIFKYITVILVILTSFMLPFVWTSYHDGLKEEPLLMGIVIVGCLLAYVCLVYWHMLGRFRGQKQLVSEEPLVLSEERNVSSMELNGEGAAKHSKEIPIEYKLRIEGYLLLEKYYDANFKLDQMAQELGVPKSIISQYFTQVHAEGFVKTINAWRIQRACNLLESPDFAMSMEELAFSCGFNSRAAFYRNFNLEKGCSPTVYRETSIAHTWRL